jgi:hypothetical protein
LSNHTLEDAQGVPNHRHTRHGTCPLGKRPKTHIVKGVSAIGPQREGRSGVCDRPARRINSTRSP